MAVECRDAEFEERIRSTLQGETKHQRIFRLVCRLTETDTDLNKAKSQIILMQRRRKVILEELRRIVLRS